MTIRPLPDTDLARIAPLPDDLKREQLQKIRSVKITITYRPVRSSLDDIFNLQSPLLGPTTATPWNQIEEIISKRARHQDELKSNLAAAKALHSFADEYSAVSRRHEFYPLPMQIGQKVSLWLPMISVLAGKPYALYVDPRRSTGLNENGRRFAFSMMHQRIRAADDDFSEIGLGIIRLSSPKTGNSRIVRFHTDAGIALYSIEELEEMVASTYRIWQEICEERTFEERRKGTGTAGPLI